MVLLTLVVVLDLVVLMTGLGAVAVVLLTAMAVDETVLLLTLLTDVLELLAE